MTARLELVAGTRVVYGSQVSQHVVDRLTARGTSDRMTSKTPGNAARSFTITPGLIARFDAKVDRSAGPDACWPWTASTRATGYGQINSGNRGTPIKAHRLAFAITNGWWPDVVAHRCDNPPCCNPAHLFAADQQTNLADMRAKGRQASGEQLGNAISTGKQRARARRHGEAA